MQGRNGIRVEDMLNMTIMQSSDLIAGFKGVGNTVSTINVMADPDIMDWVQPGEFLLTTAYYFTENNIGNLKNLIRKASYNDLAGLGVKIKPYMEELPKDVIDLADELHLPLIDINEMMPLSDVMMVISKEVFKKQASLLERIESVQSLYTSAILEGQGIAEIVKIVHINIKNPVVLSLNYKNKQEMEFGDISETSRDVFLSEVESFNNLPNGRNQSLKVREDKILHNGKFINRMIVPIILRNNIYGHLFAWSTNTPLGSFDLSILESAATSIALLVLQDMSIKEVEIRYRSELFEDLISQDSKRRKKAIERAHFLDLPFHKYYVVEVMSFKFDLDDGEDDNMFEYLKEYANTIVMSIEDIMEYYDLKGLVSTRLNGIQVLLNFDDLGIADNKLEEFNKKVVSTLTNKYPFMEVKIGVGRGYRGLDNIYKSFDDALKAIRTGKIISDNDIIGYDELGIYKILCQNPLNAELEDFYELTLESLVEYDRERSTDLVKTLAAYFEHNGNLTRMSEHLYTHYNTILYRMKRIKEITGLDLEDANDRLNLEIALKIKELL